jgi:putative DNA primase/helicase
VIQLVEGDYHLAADEAEEALLRTEWNNVYQRGGLLVRPVLEQLAAADNRATTAWRLAPVRQPFLLEMLERVVTFMIYDRRSRAWVPRNCPDRIGEMLLAREGLWKASVILGVVHTPQFRLDGSLTMVPGYDPGTRLLFKPDGEIFPPIPERPTREQALAALKLIEDQIATFPFKTDIDRAVTLSLFLTALCRRALDYAPLHGLSSPAAGTGKSMLVDLTSILLCGQDAPVISTETSKEEFEKRLGASLLASDAVISFDNCIAPLNSSLLCQALTQQRLRIRILGLSQQMNTPTSVLFTATGNNLILEGDLTRRALRCKLDAEVERPELRSFNVNPKEVFRRRRGELVAAGLTVLRAGRVAELKPISTPLGGYEMWSNWVRNPLQWLDRADPCGSMEQLYKGDPARQAHEAVVFTWRDYIGIGSEVLAQYVIDRALLIQELRTALLAVAEDRNAHGFISAKRLGHGWPRLTVRSATACGLCG